MICVMGLSYWLTGTDLNVESTGLKVFTILSGVAIVLTYLYSLWAAIKFYKTHGG